VKGGAGKGVSKSSRLPQLKKGKDDREGEVGHSHLPFPCSLFYFPSRHLILPSSLLPRTMTTRMISHPASINPSWIHQLRRPNMSDSGVFHFISDGQMLSVFLFISSSDVE
jgi:hypothetical protein